MLNDIELFRMAQAMAVHAGTRQAVVAQNIANADTPGYKARDITPFADLMDQQPSAFANNATRATHLFGTSGPDRPEMFNVPAGEANPNGNDVSLEDEMVKAAEIRSQHNRALAIYRSGLTILRSSLGRG